MLLVALLVPAALAAAPVDLDGLAALALARDPEGAALEADAAAARARGAAAVRLMDPQLMVGGENLGSHEEVEPAMVMVGATQMFRGWGEGRAVRDRAGLDALRSEADRQRVLADVRARLWQGVARIDALGDELELIDQQLAAVGAVREMALARYASGAVVSAPMGGGGMPAMQSGGMEMGGGGSQPPTVAPRGGSGGGGAMPGMGMGGGGPAPTSGPAVPAVTPVPAGGVTRATVGGEPGGLAALLRLETDIARVEADRIALGEQLRGELAVLALLTGDEAADAVAANPDAYLGAQPEAVPERVLADLDRQAAEAELVVARRAGRPDLMLQVGEQFMAEDLMPMATNVAVGAEIPLWGSRGRIVEAARADVTAAEARAARVERDLSVAITQAQAAMSASTARSEALEATAVPRARQAWDATLALFATGQARGDDVVRAWEAWIAVAREAVAARRDVQLRAAELARLGGAP